MNQPVSTMSPIDEHKQPHTILLAIVSLGMGILTCIANCYQLSVVPYYSGGDRIYNLSVATMPLSSVIAVISGILALLQIHKHPDSLRGRLIAWAGILMGVSPVLVYILIDIMFTWNPP
jgi:hypothetical protein